MPTGTISAWWICCRRTIIRRPIRAVAAVWLRFEPSQAKVFLHLSLLISSFCLANSPFNGNNHHNAFGVSNPVNLGNGSVNGISDKLVNGHHRRIDSAIGSEHSLRKASFTHGLFTFLQIMISKSLEQLDELKALFQACAKSFENVAEFFSRVNSG